uniref:Uncharacterized protein n=1 Tax=Rhizophora mucronata TaxID=61149 RepID=A0A2P2KYL8_RHIMU
MAKLAFSVMGLQQTLNI